MLPCPMEGADASDAWKTRQLAGHLVRINLLSWSPAWRGRAADRSGLSNSVPPSILRPWLDGATAQRGFAKRPARKFEAPPALSTGPSPKSEPTNPLAKGILQRRCNRFRETILPEPAPSVASGLQGPSGGLPRQPTRSRQQCQPQPATLGGSPPPRSESGPPPALGADSLRALGGCCGRSFHHRRAAAGTTLVDRFATLSRDRRPFRRSS